MAAAGKRSATECREETRLVNELLVVEGLAKSFGGIRALDGLDLALERGRIVGLIGPNGSGKTTAFNLISGILAPAAGRIRFAGRDITGQPAHRNAAMGMARTFQNIRLFTNLTVADNVAVGCHHRHGAGLMGTLLDWRGTARAERVMRERTAALLERFGLAERADQTVGSLAYGDQRRVELCRALASAPSLLLLDEPSAGMNPREKAVIMAEIDGLRRELDLGILLVEHDMKIVMGICDRIQVIAQGRMLAAGTPVEIRNDPLVIEAYLGHPGGRQRAPA